MRRAHWTPDLSEAHIVEHLLREHGVIAWAFDTEMVRQDWLKTLAFGGYRVMVSDADFGKAQAVVNAYRNGELASQIEDTERPSCPGCGASDASEDLRPRRAVFMLLIASDGLSIPFLFATHTASGASWFVASYLVLQLLLLTPGVAARIVKWRYRCLACDRTWREPPGRAFRDLAHAVEAASRDRHDPANPVHPRP
ncbi:hypothetical protein [Dokdonella soli]|uniref:DUF2007 domain-containing protein n=1 Tax=Dokdonella soli TaxID=529810 RepID=A0ABN1IBE7_9GAMM